MRYRKLSPSGDYVFGQGQANFWINQPAGVAQYVQTRLRLIEGEWFLDVTDGTPYAADILGYGTKSLYDVAIKQRILGTPGVTSLVSYGSDFDPADRSLTVGATISTQYSVTPIPVPPVVV